MRVNAISPGGLRTADHREPLITSTAATSSWDEWLNTTTSKAPRCFSHRTPRDMSRDIICSWTAAIAAENRLAVIKTAEVFQINCIVIMPTIEVGLMIQEEEWKRISVIDGWKKLEQ